ncbi:LOW QUALITY PROTEIN: uncharacterized protein LOC129235099 [Uloborus diversus]|uniref:LOW QUALITY PROTEIN: uncharacterized protein LOC129235099 n=1 Tax=Uloborus diversus TaxID=327109 RepID=UPI002409B236|nr:LOW QUALITY PROTEIN: uncharacterized protein LOC129235099 [Uloborus diversus]
MSKSLNDTNKVLQAEVNNNSVKLVPDENISTNIAMKIFFNAISKEEGSSSPNENASFANNVSVLVAGNRLKSPGSCPQSEAKDAPFHSGTSSPQKRSKSDPSFIITTSAPSTFVKSAPLVSNSSVIESEGSKQESSSLPDTAQEKLNSEMYITQMSGVTPTAPGIKKESQQLNYRVSTSVVESRNSSKDSQQPIIEEEQKCHLPSSVYGTSASNIEKVLTGLQVPETSKDGSVMLDFGKVSFLQEMLEKKSGESKTADLSPDKSLCKEEPRVDKSKPSLEQKFNPSCEKFSFITSFQKDDRSNVITPNCNKLKLHIPEFVSTDDSNSSVLSAESQKVVKCPKITSPQILEQHISKIISENAAIVETLDPMWSRRYFKQNSVNTSPNSDCESKKQGISLKLSNCSDDKATNVSGTTTTSKLQSALLGGSLTESLHATSKGLLSNKTSSPNEKSFPLLNASPPTVIPSVNMYSKIVCSVSEEELKGSAIKSLLSLKRGRYTKRKNTSTLDQAFYSQSPQNPEGSIIKDLLLKSKSKEESKLLLDVNDTNPMTSSFTVDVEGHSDKLFHLRCSYCSSEFLDKYNLDVHLSFCRNSGTQLHTLRDTADKRIKTTHAQNKQSPTEFQYKFDTKGQTTESRFESILDNANDGPILKKQLLLPLSKSPPLKKRKVSDSVLLPSFFNDKSPEPMNGKSDMYKSISSNSFSDLTLSPHRGRSQSVHLFGGEVQVLDGSQTKRIKIKTSIPGAFSSLSNKISESYGSKKSTSLEELEMDKRGRSLPGVIVTIAQPVHNSGGTVHLPSRSSSSVSPVVSIPTNFSDISKLENSLRTDFSVISSNLDLVKSPNKKKETTVSPSQPFSFLPGPDSICPGTIGFEIPTSQPYGLGVSTINYSVSEISSSFKTAKTNYYSSIFSSAPKCLELPFSSCNEKESESSPVVPTVIFTPSSPTHSKNENEAPSSESISQPMKKFLSPARPTSLSLKEKPFTMVGSTLISPETPRPKKSCIQLYLNGHAYTYLGLKCSTRSTYCCIYRPQPMFILQETNPKLSMYSNWQVVPAKEELSGSTPGQMISLYCSKQKSNMKSVMTSAKLGEPLIFTHSSYWTFRSKDQSEKNRLCATADTSQAEAEEDSTEHPQETSEPPSQKEAVLSSLNNTSESQVLSTDDSSARPDTDNTISDGDVNNSDEDDDEDCQDDGTDSSQAVPPKRVKIFEGGFKSNEDYTYVRGRGRGKYVCEECGIRCKKPSMLKKHIRTHTDLRPYKCKHCSFAFKTKGNLTKHMKSKAHHKKCTELGIVPVPTTTDDSQIDEEALAKQERIEKKKPQFSDGEDADDDDDDDDSDESDDECESDTSSMIISNQKSRMLTNGHSKKSESHEKPCADSFDDSTRGNDSVSQHSVEQEAARSLLHLSAIGEPSQWSNSTGDVTDVTSSGETEIGSLSSRQDQPLLSPLQYAPLTMSPTLSPSMRSKLVSDQWLSTESLGHRPRSYSADIPMGGGKELLSKYRLTKEITSGASMKMDESLEFGNREQYGRRYSISVAREARKPRILNPPEWDGLGFPSSSSHKWPNAENLDQPMDLSISRDLGKCKSLYGLRLPSKIQYETAAVVDEDTPPVDIGSALVTLDPCLAEPFQMKTLPALSPQMLVDYDTTVDGNSENPLIPAMEDQSSYESGNAPRSMYFVQDSVASEQTLGRKEADVSEDPPSPDIDYPVSPPSLEDHSYFFSQEGIRQSITAPEDNPSARFHAEFIVPSASSNMEEGKCVCRICNKIFAKSSHLRLHVNIHYFERPFRCDNCAVSFRTKGHLQKHKRSVSHYNKVNMNLTFGTPTVDNPRPFKCADCKIAFRIHGHLAKHLRSKMHIMKLECLGKLPFGMYAEMERSGVSLNEIDTTDCNNSLESLQVMAQKLYQRDPRRMRWQGPEHIGVESDSAVSAALSPPGMAISAPVAANFNPTLNALSIPTPAIISSKQVTDSGEVKQEPPESEALRVPAISHPEEKTVVSPTLKNVPSYVNSDVQHRIEGQETESSVSLHRSGTCHICGRLFKSAKFLQVHLYCDHPTWNPSSVGEVAPTSSSTQSTTPMQFVCDLCGKQFTNQKLMQQHVLTHAQPRPFVCEICDAGFTSSSSLISHQSTHQASSSRKDNRWEFNFGTITPWSDLGERLAHLGWDNRTLR